MGLPGTVYAATLHRIWKTGIGAWTDEEILRAVTRNQQERDTPVPLMPPTRISNHMAKSDPLSIIAYLRSLKPIKTRFPHASCSCPSAHDVPPPALGPSVDGNVASGNRPHCLWRLPDQCRRCLF